jgi:hypothetical protein
MSSLPCPSRPVYPAGNPSIRRVRLFLETPDGLTGDVTLSITVNSGDTDAILCSSQ